MKYFCALDVSLKNTAICIVNQDGDIVREGQALTEPRAIHEWLGKAGLVMERVGLEAGGLTPWLCHELLSLGYPAICIETRHAKAAMKAQKVKTDRNDARGIAHMMRTGWFREVHVKSHASQKIRVLLNNRKCLLDKRLDIDNQIRGTLKVFGLKTGKVTKQTYEGRVRELVGEDTELQVYIFPMLIVRRELISQTAKLHKLILDLVKGDEVCRRFTTVPGVGVLTSLAYKTFVDRPQRFRRSRSVGAAVGLTPKKYASGEVDYDGHITKCGDEFVRSQLFEAAQALLFRSKKPSALRAWGLRLAKRTSMKIACVAVARRLAVILHAMWRDGTEFQFSEAGPKTAAAGG